MSRPEMSVHFGVVGSTIRTQSGIYFDLLNPRPEMVRLEDIAAALSKLCRFGGQINQFYSVAQHSVYCTWVEQDGLFGQELSAQERLALLLHDAAEAYIGDITKPLKVLLPQVAEIEARIEQVIGNVFGIDFEAHQSLIKQVDQALLIHERKQLFSSDNVKWTGEDDAQQLSFEIYPWTPLQAEARFFNRANHLMEAAHVSA